MCRGGAKAIDTDFKEECMALRIEGHDDDAPDPKATSAAAASPAKCSSGSPAKRGRSPAKGKRQVVGDEDDDQDDAAQVKKFVSEVEHLVKLGCDRGKATAALVKYNDVEKALDACLDQVTEEKSPRATVTEGKSKGSHEKASPGRASRSPANRASPRRAKADASPARRSSPRQPAAPPASRPSPAQKRLNMEAANAHVIKPNASR